MIRPSIAWARGRGITVLAIWLIATTVLACKVPVFRYALERWQVDRYRMVAVIDGQHSQAVGDALDHFKAMDRSFVNIETDVIDLSTLSEEQFWQLEDVDGTADTPLLQVFYPEKDGKRIKCWEGPLTGEAISQWIDSPLRRTITDDLISGDSAVFLLVDGIDQQQNQQIEQQIQVSLADAAQAIQIPQGVVSREQASQYLLDHPEASMDDVLRSDVPLKVEFRFRRLSRNDPSESALLSIVHGLVDHSDGPILIPIFGRGRMLDAMDATECTAEVVQNLCRYMVGECSCTVKALNPGVDLILAVDWSEKLGQSVLMVDPQPAGTPTLVAIPAGGASDATGAKSWIGRISLLAGITFAVLMLYLFGRSRRSTIT